jgi:hypothetical protein
MDGIYEHERARWMATARNRKSFLYWFSLSLPFLLIIVQVASFWVSAGHTAAMIELIAPGNGPAGVIAFELGLVIFSLLIYRTQQMGGVVARLWQGLEWVMAFMIILSNIAGSLDAVARASNIKEMSFGAIWGAFGTLPLATQLGLVVGFAFAIGIPGLFIGTGQAFARLILDQSENGDPLEGRWQSEGYAFVYRAFFSHLTGTLKMPPNEAKALAKQMSAGYFGVSTRAISISRSTADVVPLELPEAQRALPSNSNGTPTGSEPISNGTFHRSPNAFQEALKAYSNGLSKQEVINQGIAKKSTAYAAWTEYQKQQGISKE